MLRLLDRHSYRIVSKLWRKLAKIDSRSRLRNEISMRQSVSSSPQEMNTKNSVSPGKWTTMDREYPTVRRVMETSISDSLSPSSELVILLSPKHSTSPISVRMCISSYVANAHVLKISGSTRQMQEQISLSTIAPKRALWKEA